MFNMLEEIANQNAPQTPVLGFRITSALQPRYLRSSAAGNAPFLPTRTNWAVQSSAVDYLHMMLVSMKHFIEEYNIKARLCITIHDEARYIVKEEDIGRCIKICVCCILLS
eukprot:m.124035 g.124035  ORF g.124035 m.124035 type:complete len:111 (-) comp12950_c0_seq31:1789-2121(-)